MSKLALILFITLFCAVCSAKELSPDWASFKGKGPFKKQVELYENKANPKLIGSYEKRFELIEKNESIWEKLTEHCRSIGPLLSKYSDEKESCVAQMKNGKDEITTFIAVTTKTYSKQQGGVYWHFLTFNNVSNKELNEASNLFKLIIRREK